MSIKARNPITSILLTLVTCGLYGFYWAFCMAKEAISVKEDNDDGLLEAILMIFLPFIGLFLTEKKFAEACQAKGIEHKDNSIMYLVMGLIGPLYLVAFYMLQTDLNKLAPAAE
jgi:hypothetical protein